MAVDIFPPCNRIKRGARFLHSGILQSSPFSPHTPSTNLSLIDFYLSLSLFAATAAMNTLFSGLVVLAVLYVWSRYHKSRNAIVPPGPKPLPFVGNILDLTARQLWLRVEKWAQQFGESPLSLVGSVVIATVSFVWRRSETDSGDRF